MTWLGQKQDAEPARPIQPAAVGNPQAAPQPIPAERLERTEKPKVASIGKSLYVKGELTGNEDLAIEGRVEGKIALTGFIVTIGQTGKVSAEIHAKSVVVGGLVEGDINADERVEVAATGTVVGNIRAPRVVLLDGSRFKGSIDMDAKSGPRATGAAPMTGRATGNPAVSHDETLSYAGATKG
jgi:cytoskeletal protein CcmA (bactofilin family)